MTKPEADIQRVQRILQRKRDEHESPVRARAWLWASDYSEVHDAIVELDSEWFDVHDGGVDWR